MLVVPVYDTLILSDVRIHVDEEVFALAEVKNIKEETSFLIVPIRENKDQNSLTSEDFYDFGVLAEVADVIKLEGHTTLNVDTKERVRISNLSFEKDHIEAEYEVSNVIEDITKEEQKFFLKRFKEYAQDIFKDVPGGAIVNSYIRRWRTINEAATQLGGYLALDPEERFAILAAKSISERYTLLLGGIKELLEIRDINTGIREKMTEEQQTSYKTAAIRRQIRYLEEELNELENGELDEEQLLALRIKKAGMTEEAEKESNRALRRLKMEGMTGHEYGALYDYLDFMTSLAWKDSKKTTGFNIKRARRTLDRGHYGLDKVKKRVLEQIAVNSIKGKQDGSILLFVGAPGTGKTSMGQGIADAMGRKYVRISLGGIRDEAEIRGHRRTYVGAMPGRIMEAMRRAGVNNPVMVLDEVDKLTSEAHGDPASALLEVLDPEQNFAFTDHYMNVPYDLSKVFFVCTANTTDGIPKPLLDRMEVINLSGYTPSEKYQIARRHLLPKAIEQTGLKKEQISIDTKALRAIIADYTMEAGVRGLRRQLDKICRDTAVKLLEEGDHKTVITQENLREILGKKVAHHDEALKKLVAGVATGLAWTQAGGDILFIEAVVTKGSGKLQITGQLGDVMKESAEIAYTLVKAAYQKEKKDFDKIDLHIHVPEGATPKDGPSAGVTLFTALFSLFLKKPVKRKLAMTGEISLRGEVLPIGGLPEKLMAAQRAGVKTVLIPKGNEEDLEEIPDEIKKKLTIIPVGQISEVARESLGIEI